MATPITVVLLVRPTVRCCMPKSKMSVSLDDRKIDQARALITVASVSELLDVALARLIEDEMEARHVEGYVEAPVAESIDQWTELRRNPLGDDVDWAALYEVKR